MNHASLPADPIRWWAHRTAPELAGAVGSHTVAVLCTAAVEQHGPHLPLSTDVDIGRGLLAEAFRQLPAEAPVLALPPLVVGDSAEHSAFAGTLSMEGTMPRGHADATGPDSEPSSMAGLVAAVGRSVARAGVRRLVVANSHGGNRAAIDEAALRLRREEGMLVVKAHWFRFPRPEALGLPEAEWVHGLHGGAVETAMMLHLHPERVRREAVADFPSLGQDLEGRLRHLGPEGTASFAWMAEDLNAAGVTGNATLATPELGARLVAHYGRVLAEVIQDAVDFPLARLGGADG